MVGSQSHNGDAMFLSLCQIMILRGGKKGSQLGCFVVQSLRPRALACMNQKEPHEETQQMQAFPLYAELARVSASDDSQHFVS